VSKAGKKYADLFLSEIDGFLKLNLLILLRLHQNIFNLLTAVFILGLFFS
jgi:hypothetical protein